MRIIQSVTGFYTAMRYTIVQFDDGVFGWQYSYGLDTITKDEFLSVTEAIQDIEHREIMLSHGMTVMV